MTLSTSDIIAIVGAVLPVVIALSGALYQHLLERLPSRQRDALAGAAQLVVTAVDQVGKDLPNDEKKHLALDLLQSVIASPLVAGKLKVDPNVLSAIVEATVHDAHTGQEPSAPSDNSQPAIGFTAPPLSVPANDSEGGSNLRVRHRF